MVRFASVVFLLAGGIALAQSPQSQPPALRQFDVVSIRLSAPNEQSIGMFTYPGGRVECTLCTVHYLLMEAFGIQKWQTIGLPDWAEESKGSERYDVQGKPAEGSPASKLNPPMSKLPPNEDQREMLQAMLRDRFHLNYHWASKEAPVYVLERGTAPLKLAPAKDSNAFPWAGVPNRGSGSGLAGTNITMAQLAVRLSGMLHKPVIDKTGLPGAFDFQFNTGDEDEGANISDSISYPLRKLGLKLTNGSGPVKTLVVDHIDRPTEN